MHGDQSPRTLKFQQQRNQSKPCEVYKQSYNAKPKSALVCQPKTTTGLTREKTSRFKTKKQEESSLNWKSLLNDWAATTSKPKEVQTNNPEDNMSPTYPFEALFSMIRNVITQEVKEALFSMGDDKSLGPDGNGNLLKELNHTIIALIPKVKSPTRVNDYRPISCCNVLFKCISKIIANRIKHSLKILITHNQSAFIPGHRITDNILLTQELMHNYHLNQGTPRCDFKVDIQKAYDMVDWEFLSEVLHGFGFHARMIAWIMEASSRGPAVYLFTLVMEVLTLMLQRRVQELQLFTYHMYCSKLELINLCFADDLFLFAYGDVNSASIIKEALEEFKDASGLTPSLPKSTAYFCNVLNHIKLSILQILPFEEVKLSVKYLGVPLVSSRLMIRDCNELLDRVQIWIQDWKNKSLSVKGKSKVAWEVVCLPRKKGGLGIRRLEVFNYALMIAHVWKLLSLKESLWVKWVHEYKLKGRSFWEIPLRGNASWGWRKILQLRPIIRNFIWYDIGDGTATSLCWPQDLLLKYPFLTACQVPIVDSRSDGLLLRTSHGVSKPFSVAQVWSDIRPRDLHDHLFFECPFARDVWDQMKVIAGLDFANPNIYAIITDILPIASRRSMLSVVAKLVVAASAYFIWQERNWRLFKRCKRTPHQICECIQASVRLKLMSCRLKKSKNGVRMARLWDFSEAVVVIWHVISAGTNALVVLRDTIWEDSRQIIRTIEVDLSTGTQLVYMFPDMVLSIDDFHNHVEVAIQTHGYDTWQGGKNNLLVTMAMIGRLSNTSYMGFQYSVDNVVDHLTTTGITAIPGERRSVEELEGMSWNLRPSEQTSVRVPSRVAVNERLNKSLSLQFERYRKAPQPAR
ncbi:hypothetical protein Tco_0686714 [Tanacetum coccineum]